MLRLPLFLLALVVGTATACSQFSGEPLGPGAAMSPDTVGSAVLANDLGGWPADPLHFRSARIVGDSLVATVSYGGGCREHTFALVFSTVFMESHPVQVRGLLSHDADGDLCRALLTRTLRFDLTPLKLAYRAAYAQDTATVVLNGNWPESLHYRF
jgi:hypothetical protein